MVETAETGVFCEVYGKTLRNMVLEYILERQDLDFAIGDMAAELKISRPKAYEIIQNFETSGYVRKTRIIGRTQLFIISKENPHIKLFMQNFMDCLRMVAKDYSAKSKKEQAGKQSKIHNKTKAKTKARVFSAGSSSGMGIAQARAL